MRAIVVKEQGGAEVLQVQDYDLSFPEPLQVTVKMEAIGVNFVDIHERQGRYSVPFPFIPGKEGAGVVVSKGEQVTDFKIGDRVGFAYIEGGAYAEYVNVHQDHLYHLPKTIAFSTAAASSLQAITAYILTHETYPVQPCQNVLVHAAGGGLGKLLVQMAKKRGATVIGTVSNEEKAEFAMAVGADFIIRYDREDFLPSVMDITAGQGVDVVYDSVGAKTVFRSADCLKNLGMLVLCGQTSGEVPPLNLNLLLGRQNTDRGSLFITCPVIRHYILDKVSMRQKIGHILSMIEQEELIILIDRNLPLENASLAHESLERRKTIGKLILYP